MKRAILLFLILSLCALPVLGETATDPLLDQAVALARRLGELAACEDYVAAYSASPAIDKIVAVWAAGDYSSPATVQRATLEPEAILTLITALTGAAPSSGLSETAYEELSRRLLNSLPSMVNGTAGTETIAAASIMTIQTAFLCEACDAPTLYILSYAHGTPVSVTFQPYEDGAVLAQAYFLGSPSDGESDAFLSGALAMLSALGVTEFEEIQRP